MYGLLDRRLLASSPLTKLATADGAKSVSFRIEYSLMLACIYSANCTSACQLDQWADRLDVPVSPASPENAIKVWLFSSRVLSSDAFKIVAPLMAAFEAATMVKSFPVIPSRTSLREVNTLARDRSRTLLTSLLFKFRKGRASTGTVKALALKF